ncbi:MAG: asparagine synthase (glutamine-hydrolyzing), partial [Cytophagaceae bacterium]
SRRGPDGRGTYIEDFVALGHRRLSIIDTSSQGSQPMKDESGRYVIVFNGEIFNYKSLKKELEEKGVVFRSDCDTEVLLKLYMLEGKKCLEKLVGFFALAIYDKQKQEIFLARDRMGVKPLLYYYDEDKFVFASEMKSLLAYNIPREIDYTSLYQYLQLNYIPGPTSIIKNVFKLQPGACLTIRDKDMKEERYYTIPYDRAAVSRNTDNYEAQQEKLAELLDESVRLRLIADVPLGAFLSGGIDSSVIVALASRHTDKLNTFSIGYRDEPFFDETSYAQLVAKKYNTEHTVFSLSNDDLLSTVFETLDYTDEPFADSSALAVYILSKHTSKKVKVALSGDGADELFAGYNKHQGDFRVREGGLLIDMISGMRPLLGIFPKSRNSAFSNKIRQLDKLAEGASMSAKDRYWRWCSFASEDQALSLFSAGATQNLVRASYEARKKDILKHVTAKGDMNEMLRTDMDLVLTNDMLFKVDMMSMANGLEVRTPFLDHRVVNFGFGLPLDSKIDRGMKKKIVQDAFRTLLPPELYKRPKHGFEVPMLKWMRRELRSWIDEMLDEKTILEQGIFDPEEIRKMKARLHSSNPEDSHARIWGLLVFQHWWKMYIKN